MTAVFYQGQMETQKEPGCTIFMTARDGTVLANISNPDIDEPQALADHLCQVIDQHNELVAKVNAKKKILNSDGLIPVRLRCPRCDV